MLNIYIYMILEHYMYVLWTFEQIETLYCSKVDHVMFLMILKSSTPNGNTFQLRKVKFSFLKKRRELLVLCSQHNSKNNKFQRNIDSQMNLMPFSFPLWDSEISFLAD